PSRRTGAVHAAADPRRGPGPGRHLLVGSPANAPITDRHGPRFARRLLRPNVRTAVRRGDRNDTITVADRATGARSPPPARGQRRLDRGGGPAHRSGHGRELAHPSRARNRNDTDRVPASVPG